jgi:hypothetical protein
VTEDSLGGSRLLLDARMTVTANVRAKSLESTAGSHRKGVPRQGSGRVSDDEQSDTDDGRYLIETPSIGTPNV